MRRRSDTNSLNHAFQGADFSAKLKLLEHNVASWLLENLASPLATFSARDDSEQLSMGANAKICSWNIVTRGIIAATVAKLGVYGGTLP